jgi:protein-tyrosine phosphatase
MASPEQTAALSALVAQVFDAPVATVAENFQHPLPVLPAAVPALEAIKASAEFAQLRGRLDAHTAQIRKTAQYRPFGHGDRYHAIRPDQRTAWPGSRQAWVEGPLLNGSHVAVSGQQIAIAAQYPLPGKSLFTFLQQLIADRTRTVVVLASEAEIADTQEQLPDYFRPSGQRSDLGLPPEAGTTVPDGPDVLGSYVSGGAYTAGRCLVMVRSIKPMQPLTTPGLASIRRAVIRVSSESAHPRRPMPSLSQDVTVIHLHNVAQSGAPSLAELEWLGGVVGAERQAGRSAVVHCNSGTGRTGLVLAASVLADPASGASVEQVVRDIRATRHWRAVGTDDQLAAAVQLAKAHGKPVLAPDAPATS